MNRERLMNSFNKFYDSSSRSRSVLRAGGVVIGGVMMAKGELVYGGVFIVLGVGGTAIEAAIEAARDTRIARRNKPH